LTPVNDAPGFTLPVTSVRVAKNSGAQTRTAWATGVSAGPADESGQTLTFIVTSSNSALFLVQPAISPSGTLTFTPAKSKSGTATVSVKLQDNGGIANSGVNTSVTRTFTIQIG
jgi:hypothetical protein